MTTVPRSRALSRLANGIRLVRDAHRRALARVPDAVDAPG
jgi:hypothetical protein